MTTYILPDTYTKYLKERDTATESNYYPGEVIREYERSSVGIFLEDDADDTFVVEEGVPTNPAVDWDAIFDFHPRHTSYYSYETDYKVYQFVWSDGVTYLLGALQHYDAPSHSYGYGDAYGDDNHWITLAGPELPDFSDQSEEDAYLAFEALLDSGTLQQAGWPLGEGQSFTLSDIPYVTITEDDVITGTDEDDTIDAGVGNDMFDQSETWGGADYFDGGAGRDSIRYLSETQSAVIDLMYAHRNAGAAEGDTLVNIEHATGSKLDDHLFGTEGTNALYGGKGSDRLVGRGGDDRLYGGDGDDILRGGLGADLLDGGEGKDWASYTFEDGPLIIDMQSPGTSTGAAQGDVFVSIEVIEGTESWDAIRGDYTDNILIGAGGNDTLRGREGDDALFGQEGDDDLFGDAGNDFLRGGEGNDSFYFHGGTDLISDFTLGEDRVFISNAHASGAVLDFQDIAEAATLRDGVLYLEFGDHALGFEGYDSVYDVADWISGF